MDDGRGTSGELTDDGGADIGSVKEADQLYTVEQLNREIAAAAAQPHLNNARVVGEVTDLSQLNTALYFTLVESDGATQSDCELECVLWQSRYRSMPVTIENGTAV